MKYKNAVKALLLMLILVFAVTACKTEKDPDPTENAATTAEVTTAATQEDGSKQSETEEPTKATQAPEDTKPADPRPLVVSDPVLSVQSGFYNKAFELEMTATEGAEIRYTLDGSEPSEKSQLYTGAITIPESDDKILKATIIRARTFGANENVSDITTEVYFVGAGAETRFRDVVISIVGDPAGLTGATRGIFSNRNYNNRGREWERAVSIKMWDANGNLVLDQDGGVRVYGAYSRQYALKSMKIFSRKSYDAEHPDFETDIFQTPKAEGTDVMSVYDKLVIRSGGNDFQFAFMRDELNQLLLAEAGYPDYENVIPAICYLNGKYYGYFWLHESYCDDYFKEKYGKKEGGRGEFIVIEGSEKEKKTDDDDEEQNKAAAEYNEMYAEFAEADLTDDAKYEELRKLIDVENYLDYFAANLIINNKDWPNNNYKCYRYYASSGEEYGDGVYDGRWRYLPHDMDYSFSIYGQYEVMPEYDMLEVLLRKNDDRSAPLFASLMKREDCKKYFKDKVTNLLETTFSEDSITALLNRIMDERAYEMDYYFTYLEQLSHTDRSVWANPFSFDGFVEQIRDYIKRRPALLLEILEKRLP